MSSPRPVTGLRQSPIDIQRAQAVPAEPIDEIDNVGDDLGLARGKRSILDNQDNGSLQVDYCSISATDLSLENTGHGWKINVPDRISQGSEITGGPLGEDRYRLLQIHAHWGKNEESGSEHTVDGQRYPAEVHLVHWNIKYASPEQAQLNSNDGLAVIGVFVEIRQSDAPNALFDAILERLDQISYKGSTLSPLATDPFLTPQSLLPSSLENWSYLGSLTTPPYSESVVWIVLKEPISAQEAQIAAFRKLYENEESDGEQHQVRENWRQVQQLNGRQVVSSID